MSDNTLQQVLHYFQQHEKYFWKWGEEGTVLEWQDGTTICYRDDLVQLLEFISNEGFPPLGAILMVLIAAKGDWKSREGMMRANFPFITKTDEAYALLQDIESLPKPLRSGDKRGLLLYTLFRDLPGKVSSAKAVTLIEVFKKGRLDNYIFRPGILPAINAFAADIGILKLARANFPDQQTLETFMRTAMQGIPGVPELELPEDLLEQLKQDGRTAGIANLTHHLIAALNIPQRTDGSSDQSFGGVSDITNRGNFDRLLLSELAHDDISLLARLANNEALYLRREEIPAEQHHHRVILLDTTIRMWGNTRIFGIAAALACARNNKAKRIIKGHALGGRNATDMDLGSKAGIMATLEQLDVALDCTDSLTTTMHDRHVNKKDEYFLVTAAETLQQPAFLQSVMALKRPLDFMIAVDREGNMQCWEFIKGRRKLWSQSKFDLDKLLQQKKERNKQKKAERRTDVPQVLNMDRFPLYFPTSKVRMSSNNTFEIENNKLISVTLDNRLLYWSNVNLGAVELMQKIDRGHLRFGRVADELCILAFKYAVKGVKLYRINWETREVNEADFDIIIPVDAIVFFKGGGIFVGHQLTYHVLHIAEGTYREMPGLTDKSRADLNITGKRNPIFNRYKSFINYGYTVLSSIKRLYINQNKELVFDNYYLGLRDEITLVLKEKKESKQGMGMLINHEGVQAEEKVLENELIKLTRFTWKNGSEIWADSRGFLHLRSIDLPEVTIVLAIGVPVACWATDGTSAGSFYFTGRKAGEGGIKEFYRRYIQPFIDALV